MKKILNFKILYSFLILGLFSFNSFSQTPAPSFKSKLSLAFTKKKQIVVLNKKIDSLNLVIKEKENIISTETLNYSKLDGEMKLKQNELIVANQQLSELESEVDKQKTSLDSLHKVNSDSHAYSLFQRNEDSLRYQNLLKKLSERNTFIVDSLKMSQAIKKSKLEPTKVETYYFKDYKSVITGVPDEKNRYTYTFELFQKTGDEYVKIENASIFNENKQQLLDNINIKIQKDFNSSYKIDPKCFTSKTPPTYDFKKLGIEFKDGKVNFYAVFDFTTENCYYLYGYTSVEFTMDEIKSYLK